MYQINKVKKTLNLNIFLLGFFLISSSIEVIKAQEIITPRGQRNMVVNKVRPNNGGPQFDIRYQVNWEAKICDHVKPYGKTPKATAWITGLKINKIYYRDEVIYGNEIGQANLRNGIEIVYFNSGVIAEFKGKESGQIEATTNVDNTIRAYQEKQDICNDVGNGVMLSHYEISREPHTIKIKNTENYSGSNKFKLNSNLRDKIILKAIDKKMNKARAASNRGDKDNAQQIALTARNMCPGGGGYRSNTKCEQEISTFLQGLDNPNTKEIDKEGVANNQQQTNESDDSGYENDKNKGKEKLKEQREERREYRRKKKELEKKKTEAAAKTAKGAVQMMDAAIPAASGGSYGFNYSNGAKASTYTFKINMFWELAPSYNNTPLFGWTILNVGAVSLNRSLEGRFRESPDSPVETRTEEGYTSFMIGTGLSLVFPVDSKNKHYVKAEAVINGVLSSDGEHKKDSSRSDSDSLFDYNIGYLYRLSENWSIGINIGSRNLTMKYSDDFEDITIDESGLYIGLNLTMSGQRR